MSDQSEASRLFALSEEELQSIKDSISREIDREGKDMSDDRPHSFSDLDIDLHNAHLDAVRLLKLEAWRTWNTLIDLCFQVVRIVAITAIVLLDEVHLR